MFKTYGTARVWMSIPGQYHEPLWATCGSPEEAASIAAALNRKGGQGVPA